MKTAEEILRDNYEVRSKGVTTLYVSEIIEAMQDYADQFKSEAPIRGELIKFLKNEQVEFTYGVVEVEEIVDEYLKSFSKKEKVIRYYYCPKCGCKLEHDGFPYWLPKAEGHQIKAGVKLCTEKYVEITKEQYNCPHTYHTKTGYCKFCNLYSAEKDIN